MRVDSVDTYPSRFGVVMYHSVYSLLEISPLSLSLSQLVLTMQEANLSLPFFDSCVAIVDVCDKWHHVESPKCSMYDMN